MSLVRVDFCARVFLTLTTLINPNFIFFRGVMIYLSNLPCEPASERGCEARVAASARWWRSMEGGGMGELWGMSVAVKLVMLRGGGDEWREV